MGYVLKAVLSSAQHPEYGQITVPFPIPDEKYDRMIELLEPLEIGDALRQDCRVDELDSFYTVLNRLVGSLVNFDELDYLAKRLDSFDDGEAAQFQGMACKLGVSNIKDFINLTFCCQQATVITDFSDLDAIGRQHYMTMQGGGCRIEELERLDGRKFALDLILNHLEGRITPYGVVYDNGMKLEQLYDGRHFPCYRGKDQESILMQKNACHDFAEKKGWNIVGEEQEIGVSGYKVSADDLVKLQRIRKAAEQGEFDILLVFMYDRLGRNLNETPFIAEWFTKKGIHVWSVYEGEIIDGVDAERMLDYIRFWQTDEAQKL